MRGLALLVTLLTVACVEPEQYGGPIPIDALGVEARLVRVCRISPQSVCGAMLDHAGDDAGEPEPDADDADTDDVGEPLK